MSPRSAGTNPLGCSCSTCYGGDRTTESRNAATMDGLNSFFSILKERFWGWRRMDKGNPSRPTTSLSRRHCRVCQKVSDQRETRDSNQSAVCLSSHSLPNRLNSASVHRSSAHSRIQLSIEKNKSPSLPFPLPFSLPLSFFSLFGARTPSVNGR